MKSPQEAVPEIIPFEPRYSSEFKRLNLEWLNRYFRVEAVDEDVLSRPLEILSRGGAIFFARYQGRIVGTCALLSAGPDRYELAKMAVTTGCQGLGIGRMLLRAAIEKYQALRGRELFLESSSRLEPALALYESAGFVHTPRPFESHYERADVYMVYRPSGAAKPA